MSGRKEERQHGHAKQGAAGPSKHGEDVVPASRPRGWVRAHGASLRCGQARDNAVAAAGLGESHRVPLLLQPAARRRNRRPRWSRNPPSTSAQLAA